MGDVACMWAVPGSGRWLPRNQGWLNFWETRLVTLKKSLHRSCLVINWVLIHCPSLLQSFSLFSFILAWTFISLQIKEFRIMGLSINNSLYCCLFFFLTGLHFFHLSLGLLLCCLLFWSCSFSSFSFFIFWRSCCY